MIRFLTKEDIPEHQKLITTVWQETYKGIVNQTYLDKLTSTEESRIELNKLNYNESQKDTLIIEENNKIIGFIRFGQTDEKEYKNTGEIFALYILSKYQKKGYGLKLVKAVISELLKQNYKNMIIGCISKNPSNQFYQHIGGKKVKERPFPKTGDNLIENIYYYEDIKRMI